MAKIKLLKGWAEYDRNAYISNLHFVVYIQYSTNYQHIIKNDNYPKNFTVEMFNGTIGKRQS